MKTLVWKILLAFGIFSFVLPLILGIYNMSIKLWSFIDWLILYSYLYWPTYILGTVLIAISVYKLKKRLNYEEYENE